MSLLESYQAKSGHFEPVWTIEIQTLPEDTDRILDEIMKVYPLSYGRYQRNASVSSVGRQTSQPTEGSTTTTHVDTYNAGDTETYPMVELKISFERDPKVLGTVMDAIHFAHHYEEPVIFLREDWVSRAVYGDSHWSGHLRSWDWTRSAGHCWPRSVTLLTAASIHQPFHDEIYHHVAA